MLLSFIKFDPSVSIILIIVNINLICYKYKLLTKPRKNWLLDYITSSIVCDFSSKSFQIGCVGGNNSITIYYKSVSLLFYYYSPING